MLPLRLGKRRFRGNGGLPPFVDAIAAFGSELITAPVKTVC